MSYNDQFEMARLPLKPLAYENREGNAQCNELMVDYGENGKYHIYITHHTDDTKYIDLSNTIITEVTESGVAIAGDNITIKIEGVQDPQTLGDILNTIWKNYLFPDDDTGFDVSRDLYKLYLDSTTNILLTDSDGTIYLPITSAENVFDSDGNSIQSRLDNMTKFAWSIDYLYATTNNQTSFEFTYPFPNYQDLMEVRIGTTYVDQTRYQVQEATDIDGNVIGGTITFNDESVEIDRRIDLIFMYNVLLSDSGDEVGSYTSGTNIANGTINSSKLTKTSDSYTLNDSTSIATSAAVYNLYMELSGMIMDKDNTGLYFDTSESASSIAIDIDFNLSDVDYFFFYVITNAAAAKNSNTNFVVSYSGSSKTFTYLYDLAGNQISNTISAAKLIKVMYKKDTGLCYLMDSGSPALTTTRWLYRASDQETVISFHGLEYDSANSIINVYRNSLRLFEDIDYSIDMVNEEITLYVRTEETELFVFEAITAH